MYTKRSEVLNCIEECGINLVEIKEYCENAKIVLTKEQIAEWLLKKAEVDGVNMVPNNETMKRVDLVKADKGMIARAAKEFANSLERSRYIMEEGDYKLYKESLEIYKTKTLKMVEILEKMAGIQEMDKATIEEFDFSIYEDEVLTCDIYRVTKPLKTNFDLLKETELKGNNPSTYLVKVSSPNTELMSYKELLPYAGIKEKDWMISKSSYISLTEKQRKEEYAKELELIKKIFTSVDTLDD